MGVWGPPYIIPLEKKILLLTVGFTLWYLNLLLEKYGFCCLWLKNRKTALGTSPLLSFFFKRKLETSNNKKIINNLLCLFSMTFSHSLHTQPGEAAQQSKSTWLVCIRNTIHIISAYWGSRKCPWHLGDGRNSWIFYLYFFVISVPRFILFWWHH